MNLRRVVIVVLVAFLLASFVTSGSRADSIISTVTVGTAPFEIAVHGGSNTALVTNQDSSSVSRIRTTDFTVVATITVGSTPKGIVIDSNGQYAYATSFGSNKIWRIDLSTNTATAWATVGSRPYGIVITSDNANLYVSNDGSSSVSKVSTATAAVTNISVGSYPRAIAISADDSKVIVVRAGGVDAVAIIDTATNAATGHGVYSFPNEVIASLDANLAYVGNSRSITTINLNTGNIESSFSVEGTDGLSIDPTGRYIYGSESFFYDTVGVDRHYFIYKYALAHGRFVEKIRVEAGPYGVATAGSPARVLAANSRTNTVSVLSMQDKYDQTISFAPSDSMYYKLSGTVQQMTLTATSSSGLVVSLSVTTPTTCEITAGKLIPKTTGTCTIEARQTGDSVWNAAGVLSRSVVIDADPFQPAPNNQSSPTPTGTGPTTALPASTTIPIRSPLSTPITPLTLPIVTPLLVGTSPSLVTPSFAAKVGKSVSSGSLLKTARISTPSTSKISLSVASASRSVCKVSGLTVKMLKKGTCQVTVVVLPKKGARTSKLVAVKVS